MSSQKFRVAVVGATGYTGAELLRLLLGHPNVEITAIVGQSKAGRPVAEVLPSFAGILRGDVEAFDADSIAERADVAFCGLPHGASAPIVAALRQRGLSVFDLSADFRLADLAVHAEWYGGEPRPPELIGQAVYGMVELHREELRGAKLVAVAGCYPTAASLSLAPLLRDGLVSADGIVVDAKSGVSGAGRSPSEKTHLPEAAEGLRAYKIASHRHTPEIEQELSRAAGRAVTVLFTPHLVPMTRGILSTSYAVAVDGTDAQVCTDAARRLYEGSPSVVVLDPGGSPDTLWVRGSNRVHISYTHDPRTGRIVALAAIDNLVKGASGQAVQCMNVALGLPEGAGVSHAPMWP
jgi:N-acetyl-gamma-glutamyl-phosphate reductase